MYILKQDLACEYLGKKNQYDAYNRAIRIAKRNGMLESEQVYCQLVACKQDLGYAVNAIRARILKAMPKSDNLCKFSQEWFGVRYITAKGEVCLLVEPLREKDMFVLQREGARANLTQIDIDLHIEPLMEKEVLNQHKENIRNMAIATLKSHGVEFIQYPKFEREGSSSLDGLEAVKVSFHALNRWALRKLGIKGDKNIESYVNENQRAIVNDILDSFNESEPIFVGLDGMEFWIDSANIIYAVGRKGGPTIVTLYEAEFGWDKSANRWLVMNHLGAMQQSKEEYERASADHDALVDLMGQEMRQYDLEIKELEEKISHLCSKKQVKLAQVEESSRGVRILRATHEAQFNKVFRRWEE